MEWLPVAVAAICALLSIPLARLLKIKYWILMLAALAALLVTFAFPYFFQSSANLRELFMHILLAGGALLLLLFIFAMFAFTRPKGASKQGQAENAGGAGAKEASPSRYATLRNALLTKEVQPDDMLMRAAYLREQALEHRAAEDALHSEYMRMPLEDCDIAPDVQPVQERIASKEPDTLAGTNEREGITAERELAHPLLEGEAVAPEMLEAEALETESLEIETAAQTHDAEAEALETESLEIETAAQTPDAKAEAFEASETKGDSLEFENALEAKADEAIQTAADKMQFAPGQAMADGQEYIPETASAPEPEYVFDAPDIEHADVPETLHAEEEQAAPTLMGLLDAAYADMAAEDFQSACASFEAALPLALEPYYIQRIKLELLNMLMRTNRKREAVDLVFDILGAGYALNLAETTTLFDVLQELQKGV